MEIQILEILSCNVWDAQFLTIHTSLNSKKDIFVYVNVERLKSYMEKKILNFKILHKTIHLWR